jgi:hypothetical protein
MSLLNVVVVPIEVGEEEPQPPPLLLPIELAEDAALQAPLPPAVDVQEGPQRELLLSGRGWQAVQQLMRAAQGVAEAAGDDIAAADGELPSPPSPPVELAEDALQAAFPGQGWLRVQQLVRAALRAAQQADGELPPQGPDNDIELGMEALEFEEAPWANRALSPSDWGSQQEDLDRIHHQLQPRVAAPLVMSYDEWLLHRGHMEAWMANVEEDWLVNFDQEAPDEGMIQRAWRAARRVGRAICEFCGEFFK